jgi:hypothetical protein
VTSEVPESGAEKGAEHFHIHFIFPFVQQHKAFLRSFGVDWSLHRSLGIEHGFFWHFSIYPAVSDEDLSVLPRESFPAARNFGAYGSHQESQGILESFSSYVVKNSQSLLYILMSCRT